MDLEIGFIDMFISSTMFSSLLDIYLSPFSMSSVVIIEAMVKLILSVLENSNIKNLNVRHRFKK